MTASARHTWEELEALRALRAATGDLPPALVAKALTHGVDWVLADIFHAADIDQDERELLHAWWMSR